MKSLIVLSLIIGVLLICSATAFAQDTLGKEKPLIKVKKRTIMEQYDPDMVMSVEERIRLKEERYNDFLRRKSILDTMDISRSRKRKLLRDLYQSPFSDRLSKAIVDTDFEEDEH